MTNRNLFCILFLTSILLFNLVTFCAKIVIGNTKNLDHTFDFDINSFVFNTKEESYNDFQLYIGSAQEIKGNNYSIAKVTRSTVSDNHFKFVPLCPEKVKFNNYDLKENPLYGAKILHLDLIGEYPVVVKDKDKKIYVLSSFYGSDKEKVSLFHSAELNDANGKPVSEILKIATVEDILIYGSYIIAAVKGDNSKDFGTKENGSGIALIYISDAEKVVKEKNEKTKKEEERKIRYPELRALNADSSEEQKCQTKKVLVKTEDKKEKLKQISTPIAHNKAAPFNGSINAIKINENANVISDIVDMHYDKRLKRIYICCTVKSSENAGSGARAVLMARLFDANEKINNKLIFQPIVCDKAVSGNNQIIATGLQDSIVSIQRILTMHTSTLLSYLIVVGGNGAQDEVGNKVYALPLVNREKEIGVNINKDISHGTLAKFDQEPKYYFVKDLFRDKGRLFVQPAECPADLLTNNDQAAIVGFGDLPLSANQKISDIFVVNDSVFVCINNDYNGITHPGIYSSQAIFDAKGRICSWTKWARVAGTDKKIKGAALDVAKGNYWYITNNERNKTVIETTSWGKNFKDGLLGGTKNNSKMGLMTLLENYFHLSQGGVHGIFDFSKYNNGFDNFSMMIATGFKKLALIETGSLRNNFFKPTKEDFATGSLHSTNGYMPASFEPTKFVLISGGQLNEIGSITSANIASNLLTDDHWIFIGGVEGLAVLVDENGRTWNGKISSLNQISNKCKFKKIGNYSFVSRLQSDGQFLYVLTNNRLDRIRLSTLDFKADHINVITLADSKYFRNIYFNDFGVSDKFALLATTNGLFRVGNFRDIKKVNNQDQVNWTKVNIPESLPIASKLFFVSPTGEEADFAFRGQVYVLSSYRSFNQARLNRFVVNLTSDINDKTIEPLPDLFVKDKLSNFFDFNIFKDNFWTNGALLFSSCSKDTEMDLYLHILAPKILTGIRSFTVSNVPVDLDIKDKNFDMFQIGKLTQISSSGALLINGNFGLRSNN